MTNAQSKICTAVSISCKEYMHPWTDHCTNAVAGLLLTSTPYCLRVYTVVYALSLLMRHRIPTRQDIKRTILGIIQSTGFLVTNSYTFYVYSCLLRRLIGQYYGPTIAFVPCFLASWTALAVERPARRPLLALYVANVATETLWNMGVSRGMVRSIPHGQTMIFGVSVSILLYLYRLGLHKSICKDSIFNILQIFVGKTEAGPIKAPEEPLAPTARSRPPLNLSTIAGFVDAYGRLVDCFKQKHKSCPHKGICVNYALLGGLKPFLGGVGLQVALKLIMNVKRIVQMRMNWRQTIFNKNTLNLGIFLGSFSLLYKSVSCALRHTFGWDDPAFAIPAGLIGSIAFTKYPDVTVALYVMWKMIQIVYSMGLDKGVLPRLPFFWYYFYSFCTAVLFHAAILEPTNLRPSYFKFLQAISGERLCKFQLEAFNACGFNAAEEAKIVMKRLNIDNSSKLPRFALA